MPLDSTRVGEPTVEAAVREAHEEVGVRIAPHDLTFTHVVHHRNGAEQGRIGLFFTTTPVGRRGKGPVKK